MYQKKSILAVVPARGGSKGVKLKNIQPVNGMPLVAIAGELVKKLSYVDRAVISTDHPRIAEVARASGLEAPFFRPGNLSGDVVSDWDVLDHALRAMEEMDHKQYDIVINLQPTCPLRRPEHVTMALEKLVRGGFDAVWTVSETDSKNHPLKQLVIKGDELDYYDPEGSRIIARQQLKSVYHRNGAAYVLTRQCLLEQKSIKGKRTSAVIIDEPLVSIDTEYDFRLVEFFLKGTGK